MKHLLIGCKTDKGNLWIQHPGLSLMWQACDLDLCDQDFLNDYIKFLSKNLKTKFKYIDIDECHTGLINDNHIEIELWDNEGNMLEAAE